MKLSAPRASAPPKATPKRRRAPDPCSVNANTRPVTITATVMSTSATVRDAAQETADELQLRLPRTLELRLAPEQTGSAWRHSSRRRRSSGSQVVVHSDDRHRACHRRRRGADSLIASGSLDLVRDLDRDGNRLKARRSALVPRRADPGIAIFARRELVRPDAGANALLALQMIQAETIR
jgi:hypothetical protein